MNRSQENNLPLNTGQRLRALIPEILQSWESDVRRELPVAQLFESSILCNTLPQFLERLAIQLEGRWDGATHRQDDFSAEHGRERAKLNHYSAEQVLQEYRLLRRRVSMVLRRSNAIGPLDAELIYDAFERAGIEAVAAFSARSPHDGKKAKEVSADRMEKILSAVPIPLVLLGAKSGRLLFANRAAEMMHGGPLPEDFFADNSNSGGAWESPDGNRLGENSHPLKLIAQGKPLRGHEVVWCAPRGRFHVGLFSETAEIGDGEAVVVLLFVDISKQKESEEALEQALAARNELISVVGHELRTPLTGLLLQLQLMEHLSGRNGEEGLPGDVLRNSLQPAIRQTNRLQDLVDRLMDLSRIQNNRLHLDITAVDLCSIVADVTDRLTIQAKAAGTDLRLIACNELFAYVDALRIEQVIANLVTNAVKYGAGKPVEVGVAEQGENAVIEVRDHGIGISLEDQQRIFQRFERATDSKRSESLGIGLYICYQIVLAHGGRFEIESEPGCGSLFRVVLPAKRIEPSVLA